MVVGMMVWVCRGEASGKYLVFEPRISFPDASPLPSPTPIPASGKYLAFEPRISFPDASPLLNRGCRPFAVLGPVDRVGNNIPADAIPFLVAADELFVIKTPPQ